MCCFYPANTNIGYLVGFDKFLLFWKLLSYMQNGKPLVEEVTGDYVNNDGHYY